MKITTTQLTILKLFAQGLTLKEVAQHQQRSLKTIDAHRYQMTSHMNGGGIRKVIRAAISEGLIDPREVKIALTAPRENAVLPGGTTA